MKYIPWYMIKPTALRPVAAVILMVCLISLSEAQNYITPEYLTTLSAEVDETSGLIFLDGEIWTHNDSGGEAEIYQIDPSNGVIVRTVQVTDANNEDWEDITMDDDYVYIGDVGNNDGSRTNLKIYRISRSDLAVSDEVSSEKIKFSYSDQTSFEPEYHNTNYDCEGIIHYQDQLYLFTKNWIDLKTNCYVLPKTIGTHEAMLLSGFDVSCLVSGATMVPSKDALVLIGYAPSGVSYTWLFEGLGENDFFSGTNTKLVWTLLSQIEGVCDAGANDIYISSEEFSGILDPTLFYLDLSGFLTGIEVEQEPAFRVAARINSIEVTSIHGQGLSGMLSVYHADGSLIYTHFLDDQRSVSIPMKGQKGIFMVVLDNVQHRFTHKLILP